MGENAFNGNGMNFGCLGSIDLYVMDEIADAMKVFYQNKNPIGAVVHAAFHSMFHRHAIHKRTKAHALHQSCDMDADAGRLRYVYYYGILIFHGATKV